MNKTEGGLRRMNLSGNILRLRRERQITQEMLAKEIGVTKASVSKWETGQSYPDLSILPRLAAYFDVSLDDLIGYSPRLEKDQIARIYHELAADFAAKPFDEVFLRCQRLIRQYYSCYPFLYRMGMLLLNHFSLAGDAEGQGRVLEQIRSVCVRIQEMCRDPALCSDVSVLKGMVDLQQGRADEVVRSLGPVLRPDRLIAGGDTLLIDAYLMLGDRRQANGLAQLSLYSHLMLLLTSSAKMLSLYGNDLKICRQTVKRVDALVDAFGLERLHPNNTSVFYYQAAIVYAVNGAVKDAVRSFERCVRCFGILLSEDPIRIHGDDYFNELEEQFARIGMDEDAPRDRRLVLEDIRRLPDHPAFAALAEDPDFIRLKRRLLEELK
ncbi:MAG: helix-turn-helix domain-containing protein [Eubacteriales bacterium]